ncbi:MAG: TAXI family TRAP transporter solute-binding subunit, partial [Planctomycetota bacterium]|nr:TAXI family TRAP transporter solute-binding subunit [Planctomycetota bacterium]
RDQRIVRCLDIPDTRLIGLDSKVIEAGNAAGFCTANPFYTPYNIPKHLYGQAPASPISTIAVEAILVAHRDTPKDVVHEVSRLLFANRSNLVEQNPALADLSEGFNRGRLRYPLHSGAQAYLERENPGFLVKYAEAMGFVVSIIVTLFAFLAGVHEQLKRTKKNRIDDYYEQVGELLKEIGNEVVDQSRLKAIRRELWEIEQRAFRELIDEKLMADESFSIFQAVLSQCLGQAERLIDRKGGENSASEKSPSKPEAPSA